MRVSAPGSARPGLSLPPAFGDLVSLVTADVETIELFFAHTIAPGFVAIMVLARCWRCWRISPGRWRWCYCRFSWPWG